MAGGSPAAIARARIAASGMPRPPLRVRIARRPVRPPTCGTSTSTGRSSMRPSSRGPDTLGVNWSRASAISTPRNSAPKKARTPFRNGRGEAGSSGGSAGSAMARSDPALASLTASSEIRWRIAPICTSAFGAPCSRTISSSSCPRALAICWRSSRSRSVRNARATALAIWAARSGSRSVAEMLMMFASCSTEDWTSSAMSSPSSAPGTRLAAWSSTLLEVSRVSVVASWRWVEASSVWPSGDALSSNTRRAVAV